MSVTVNEILDECTSILNSRGDTYSKEAGETEDHFQQIATAFNAITGRDITNAEVCLLLGILKDIRLFEHIQRHKDIHKDSVYDGINYHILKAKSLLSQ